MSDRANDSRRHADPNAGVHWATAGRDAEPGLAPPPAPPARSPRRRPRRRLPAEVLTDEEVRKLMTACDPDTAIGLRHRALLAVLYRAGLRISEALQLRPKDVDPATGTIRVLFGKRGYARTVGVDPGAMAILAEWMGTRSRLGYPQTAPLFCTASGRQITSAYIRRWLPNLARKAGIYKRVHAHGFRHTHAAQLRSEGVDITSILGGIQPGPFQRYMTAGEREDEGDDGLVQRFQLTVWPDISKEWINVDRWPDSEARERAYAVFDGMDALEPGLLGADHDRHDPDGIPFLRFDDEAQELFDSWRTDLERTVRSGDLHPALESHFAKYRSLTPSLALLIHLAEGGRGAVGIESLRKAIRWGEYLGSHARRIYSHAQHPEVGAAIALGKKIMAGEIPDGFPLRDVYRKGWSGLSDAATVEAGAILLVELGWLREEVKETEGREGIVFRINPRIAETGDSNSEGTPSTGTDRGDRSTPSTPSVGSVGPLRGPVPEIRPTDTGLNHSPSPARSWGRCGHTRWWRRWGEDGPPTCGVCHPPAPGVTDVEWLEETP